MPKKKGTPAGPTRKSQPSLQRRKAAGPRRSPRQQTPHRPESVAPTVPWNSAAAVTLAREQSNAASTAWEIIARHTIDRDRRRAHLARARICAAAAYGGDRNLRDLGTRAASLLRQQSDDLSDRLVLLHDRAQQVDDWTTFLEQDLARRVPSERIAWGLVMHGRSNMVGGELAGMLADHCPELFAPAATFDQPPSTWVEKIRVAVERARRADADHEESAERVLVAFLSAVGVPRSLSAGLFSFRQKAVKRGVKRKRRR